MIIDKNQFFPVSWLRASVFCHMDLTKRLVTIRQLACVTVRDPRGRDRVRWQESVANRSCRVLYSFSEVAYLLPCTCHTYINLETKWEGTTQGVSTWNWGSSGVHLRGWLPHCWIKPSLMLKYRLTGELNQRIQLASVQFRVRHPRVQMLQWFLTPCGNYLPESSTSHL